jgi:hypothetical protein
MKIYNYIIVCKRPNYRLIDGISQLMLVLALIVLSSSLSFSNAGISKTVLFTLAFIIGIIGWWVYCFINQKKGNIPFYRLALLIAAIGWYYQPNGLYVSLIYLFAAIMEKQVKFPQEIAFDDEGIVVNSFPKKQVYWPEIANVVLKDGMITIDFQNNQLIQKEIETPVNSKTEIEFTEFCRDKINAERVMLKA